MTELKAVEEALSTLKAHGGTYDELKIVLGAEPHETAKIINACAELLRKRGHNACAESLLRLQWSPAS